MQEIRKILFSTDFSDSSKTAFEHAKLLATSMGAELHVQHVYLEAVNVYGVSGMPIPVPPPPDVNERICEQLKSWCEGTEVIIAEAEHEYSVPMALKHYADEENIDLIVVGTHARKGVARFFLGSVAAELIRISSIPVLVVAADHAVGSGYRKIASAIDFSESSLRALKYSLSLAKTYHADLAAIHVVDIGNLPPYFPDEFAKVEMTHASKALGELLLSETQNKDIEQIVEFGDPHKKLLECLATHSVDMLMMGTKGLRGLEGLLTGSVADRVIRAAPCPVMVIPMTE